MDSETAKALLGVERELGRLAGAVEALQDKESRCDNHGKRIADLEATQYKAVGASSLAGIIVGSGMDWLLKLWRTQ